MKWRTSKVNKKVNTLLHVDGLGTYVVMWDPVDRTYRAYLNGRRTVYVGHKVDVVQRQVERVVAQLEQMDREQEVKVQLTELIEPKVSVAEFVDVLLVLVAPHLLHEVVVELRSLDSNKEKFAAVAQYIEDRLRESEYERERREADGR